MTSFAEYTSADTADGMLVRAFLAGDTEAFEALYRRYHPDIRRYLHGKTGDLTLAEDVAQETMVRALRYLHTYDPARPFWPWLKTIAVNLLATERQRRSGEVLVEEVDRGVGTFPDGSDAVVSRDAVIACLAKLPKRQSRALVMRYVEDRDSNDIAALFDLSRNALEQLILRGKTGFKKEYRSQNGAAPLLGGFAALAARVRRILTAFETRLNVVAGSPILSASDIAVGAALTVGGLGIVAATFAPSGGVVEALSRHGAGRSPASAVAVDHHDVRDQAVNDRDVRPAARGVDPAAYAVADVTVETEGTAADGSVSGGGGGSAPTTAAVPEKVNEEKPRFQQKPPTPPDPPRQQAQFDTGSVGVDGVAGASIVSDTDADPDDGGGSSTEATVQILGHEESAETNSSLGDNDFCPVPGCPID